MKIILKKFHDNTSYKYVDFSFENEKISILDFNKLNKLFYNSFNLHKILHGFNVFIENNHEKLLDCKNYLFVDYSNYSNLFLIFKDELELLNYVQDVCEARGEKIPKNFNDALSYLVVDNVYISIVEEFSISLEEWKNNLSILKKND